MAEIAFGAGGVLETGAKEQPLPAGKNVGAENAVKGTRAESEVMSGNAAGREAVFAFDIGFVEMAGVSCGEFDSTEDVPGECVIFVEVSVNDVVSDEGGVADAELGSILYDRAVRTSEFPVDHGKIELDTKA